MPSWLLGSAATCKQSSRVALPSACPAHFLLTFRFINEFGEGASHERLFPISCWTKEILSGHFVLRRPNLEMRNVVLAANAFVQCPPQACSVEFIHSSGVLLAQLAPGPPCKLNGLFSALCRNQRMRRGGLFLLLILLWSYFRSNSAAPPDRCLCDSSHTLSLHVCVRWDGVALKTTINNTMVSI